jgi:hypothetical protein
MGKLTFNKFIKIRKDFLEENKTKDHIVLNGCNNVLISAPHGVYQVRLGKSKVHEIGSLATALWLQQQTGCYLIAKTKCNNDDANFDDKSKYKDSIRKLMKQHNIKYVLDFHGLASHRDCDVNLGTHLGNNIKTNIPLFNKLNDELISNGYVVSIDQPFMANSRTISSSMVSEFSDVWALQIEINCGISNKKENFERNHKLLNIVEKWITEINN